MLPSKIPVRSRPVRSFDLITPQGWRAAIGAYNAPVDYAVKVTDLANRYARQSLTP